MGRLVSPADIKRLSKLMLMVLDALQSDWVIFRNLIDPRRKGVDFKSDWYVLIFFKHVQIDLNSNGI